jgi:16S rRNA (cytidine1402-2'-O)-methyltransferase
MKQISEPGILYLVATPIGNLEDISLRALRILGEVDFIAAEDTRQTIKLLNHYKIKNPLKSYYEHNKAQKGEFIIKQLQEGKNIALVSDAGTPGISDPGEDLVKLAVKNGLSVTIIPGPVAAISGLVLSGMPTERFVFEGFIPMNKKLRKQRINAIKKETGTIVFYEAPHKMLNTLKDLIENLGDRNIVIAREITKKFEQIIRCRISEAIERYSMTTPRGEFVLIVEGANEQGLLSEDSMQWDEMSIPEHVEMYVKSGEDKKEAIKRTSEERGISRREVYNAVIKDKEKE